jgi:hypothetical protein
MTRIPTIFSPDRRYRFTLWREWPAPTPYLLYTDEPHLDPLPGQRDQFLQAISLNPSTADENKNDNTVTRWIDYAKRWGFGGLCVTNLFGFRATDPDVMKAEPEPVGADNDHWLRHVAERAGMVVCAWGNDGRHLRRAEHVRQLLAGIALHRLTVTDCGEPGHPLYLKKHLTPVPMGGSEE